MPNNRLKEFLDHEHVRYVSIEHSPAYTAQEIAATAHVPGRELAKTVVVHLDDRTAMAVLPANQKIVLQDLREAAGAEQASLASEDEMKSLFPDCEVGAMPPFGNLFGLDVYVAPALAEDGEIAFNAGSHDELIRMSYQDYAGLVHPKIASFST